MQTWNTLKMEITALEAKVEATPDKEAELKEVSCQSTALRSGP